MNEEILEFYPELINYWAEHGAEIQRQNRGKFLVLVAGSDPEPEYYTDPQMAIARAKQLGTSALFISIPAEVGENDLAILE